MWRLRRRAAGRCTGPYTGAAVGAMCGPYRRRASGDAAVVRVVVCTVARPLVRILVRGGCLGFGHGFVAGAVGIVIRWAAVQFVLCVRHPLVLHDGAMIVTLLFVGRQGFGMCIDAWPCRSELVCSMVVVIRAPQKGNPPAPVAMQGDAVSGYGF